METKGKDQKFYKIERFAEMEKLNHVKQLKKLAEDKLIAASYKEAFDLFVAAAESTVEIAKACKTQEIVQFAKAELPLLLNKVLKVVKLR